METIKRNIYAPCNLSVREVEGKETRTICGYAIVFNERSVDNLFWEDGSIREIIAPEAVTEEMLERSDIKMTMYHNREKLLARSNKGKGSLSYIIDERGVYFEFDAPKTSLGDEALELVKRGDIAGCSFAFTADYHNRNKVEYDRENKTYIVRSINEIFDFTLASDPAYPQTDCSTREAARMIREIDEAKEETVEEEPKEEPIETLEETKEEEVVETPNYDAIASQHRAVEQLIYYLNNHIY